MFLGYCLFPSEIPLLVKWVFILIGAHLAVFRVYSCLCVQESLLLVRLRGTRVVPRIEPELNTSTESILPLVQCCDPGPRAECPRAGEFFCTVGKELLSHVFQTQTAVSVVEEDLKLLQLKLRAAMSTKSDLEGALFL